MERLQERFDSIVLSDTQCFPDSPQAKINWGMGIVHVKENGVELYAGESVRYFFSNESISKKATVIAVAKEMIVDATV